VTGRKAKKNPEVGEPVLVSLSLRRSDVYRFEAIKNEATLETIHAWVI
jgi:hypothetical protein